VKSRVRRSKASRIVPSVLVRIKQLAQGRLAALSLYVVAMALLFRPVLSDPFTIMFGHWGFDCYEGAWYLWWYKHALLDLHTNPLRAPQIFYPVGFDLRLGAYSPVFPVLAIPLTATLGPVATYNLLLYLSFVFTAFGTYLLARYLIERHRAPSGEGRSDGAAARRMGFSVGAFAAGLYFAFCSYRLMGLGGHLNLLLGTVWAPLALLYVERTLEGLQRDAMRRADPALAGLFFALAVVSHSYYLYVLGLPLLVYVAVRLWPWGRHLQDRWHARQTFSALALAAITAGVVAGPVGFLAIQGRAELATSAHPPATVVHGAISLQDWLLPNETHQRWLSWFRTTSKAYYYVSLGHLPWILAGVALLSLRAGRKGGRRRLYAALAAMILVSWVLALGPALKSWGDVVALPAAPEVAARFHRFLASLKSGLSPAEVEYLVPEGHVFFPLPSLLLYLFMPGYDALRGPARYSMTAQLALLLLAALAVVLLTVLDLGILTLRPPTTVAYLRKVDRWLAQQPGDFSVIEYPLLRSWASAVPLYNSSYHGKNLPVAKVPAFWPAHLEGHLHTMHSFPAREALDLLRSWDVKYVLIHSQAEHYDLDCVQALGDLRHVGTFVDDLADVPTEPIDVYELLPQGVPPDEPPTLIDVGGCDYRYVVSGFFGQEVAADGTTYRWTGGASRLLIPLVGEQPVTTIRLRIGAGPRPKDLYPAVLRVMGNGHHLADVELTPQFEAHEIEVPASVPEGVEALDLRLEVPTWFPQEHGFEGDPRELGVIVDRLEIEYGPD
jgi:hypothetical protein